MPEERLPTIGNWNVSELSASVPRSHGSMLVNHKSCSDLGDRIFDLINSASASLWIASPFIDDPLVVKALISARQRRVRVKVITELKDIRKSKRGRLYTQGFEPSKVSESELKSHRGFIREFARNRIGCRCPKHSPHFKLVITDQNKLIISSANLTANSFGGTASSAFELGAFVDCAEQIGVAETLIQQLWNTCPMRLHLSDNDVSLQQQGGGEEVAAVVDAAANRGLLINSPRENVFTLTDALLKGIKGTSRELIIVSMSFYEANKVPELEEALYDALQRNVKVVAIVRPERFREQEKVGKYPDPSTRRLLEAGLQLKGIHGLHAKGMMFDRTHGMVFSANINPFSLSSGETNHIEMGIALASASNNFEHFKKVFLHILTAANHQYFLREA